jgi:small-conductance mechanosensitive channel
MDILNSVTVIKAFIGLAGAPVIAALIQVIKPYVEDKKAYPIIAIVLGLLFNFVATIALNTTSLVDLVAAGFLGLLAGLGASGLYSDAKTYKEG